MEKYSVKRKCFTGKHLCWSRFFNKDAGWMSVALLKRDSDRGFFMNFAKWFRLPIKITIEHSQTTAYSRSKA